MRAPHLRGARGALDAMNAAVVALMAVAAGWLVWQAVYDSPAQRADWLGLIILGVTLVFLWKQVNATWLILAAGVIGVIVSLVG